MEVTLICSFEDVCLQAQTLFVRVANFALLIRQVQHEITYTGDVCQHFSSVSGGQRVTAVPS